MNFFKFVEQNEVRNCLLPIPFHDFNTRLLFLMKPHYAEEICDTPGKCLEPNIIPILIPKLPVESTAIEYFFKKTPCIHHSQAFHKLQ